MPFDPNKPFTTAFDPSQGFKKVSPGALGEAAGALSTLYRSIPFADEVNDYLVGKVMTGKALLTGSGGPRKPGESARAYAARIEREAMARQRMTSGNLAADFKERRPRVAALTEGIGLAVQAAPVGGATLPIRVGARGLMGSSARAATTAGLSAQAAGLGGEGTVQQRVQAANEATVPAMALGAVLPAGIAGAGLARRKVADGGRALGRTTARIANRATGGTMLDPNIEALKRIGEALQRDGLGPAEVRQALATWQRSGASDPAFMDLAGENTRALIRAAAMKDGPARTRAVKYGATVAADLQDNAINRTRMLPGGQRNATGVADELETLQGRVADEMYAEPYAQPAPIDARVVDALQDEPGKAALRRARAAAVARRNPQQVAEIDALLRAEPEPTQPFEWYRPAPDEVSGGTLDRVRIAMGGRGAKMNQSPDTRDIAGGLFSRASDIDAALDDIPGLAPARQTYKGIGATREALEMGRTSPFNDPDAYEAGLRELTDKATPDGNPFPVAADDIRAGAQVGLTSEMERMIGAPAENATGVLNRLSSGTNTGRVHAATFGDETAATYRDALGREIERVNNARFISPNTGSQTAGRLFDDQLVDVPTFSKVGMVRALFEKLQRGVSLTDAERAALVEIGTTITRTGGDIPRIPTTPQAMRLLGPADRQRLSQTLATFEGLRQGNEAGQPIP